MSEPPYPLTDETHGWVTGTVVGMMMAHDLRARPVANGLLYTAELIVDLPPGHGVPHAHLVVLPPHPVSADGP